MTYKTKIICSNCKAITELTIPKKTKVSEFLKKGVKCPKCEISLSEGREYIQ